MLEMGQKIRELRRSNGLSQTDLAKVLKVSQDTISLWELNKSTPDAESIVGLSKTFGVSTDYLLGVGD